MFQRNISFNILLCFSKVILHLKCKIFLNLSIKRTQIFSKKFLFLVLKEGDVKISIFRSLFPKQIFKICQLLVSRHLITFLRIFFRGMEYSTMFEITKLEITKFESKNKLETTNFEITKFEPNQM